MTPTRPEVHDTPPASPQLSDTTSLPATESDLANLSDVSGLSEDEDKNTSDVSDSDFGGPDDDEEFTDISRSMVESAFVDVAGDFAASSGDESSPTTAESPDANANKEKKGSRHRSKDRTPSSSISLTRSSIRKAAKQNPSGLELRYPDPASDGLSPFRSRASLDDSVASDDTVAAIASSKPDEGSNMSCRDWEFGEESMAMCSDKAALVTSITSSTGTEALVDGPHPLSSKLTGSIDPFVCSPDSSAIKEAATLDGRKTANLFSRRATLWHPSVLACGLALTAIALGVYHGQGGQISAIPAKAAFAIHRTDLIIHPNISAPSNLGMTVTHPPVVDTPSASASSHAVIAATTPMSPVSTNSIKAGDQTAIGVQPLSASSAVTTSHSAITDQMVSALVTVPEGTKSDTLPRSKIVKGKDRCRGAVAPVAGASYAHAISALSLYNERIRSLSLSRYVPNNALQALKPSIFNKTNHMKQKRRARQIRQRLAKRARQSYSVLKGDIPISDAKDSVHSRRSRKQKRKEEVEQTSETAQAGTESTAIPSEPICTCKCSQDASKSSSSQPSEVDPDELVLSPIRTPKRVLESMDYLTFVRWVEQVVQAHFINMASYLSIDPATSKHLKRKLHQHVDPVVSLGWRCSTLHAHAKQAVQREVHGWKKRANVVAKRIKHSSRKSASKARRNARTVVKRMYRK